MDFEPKEGPAKPRRKTTRRPLINRAPISARLVLDSRLRGPVGFLSDDLFEDLFRSRNLLRKDEEVEPVCYVAVSPYVPSLSPVEDLSWTIIAVRPRSSEDPLPTPISHSTVLFSESAESLQPFVQAVGKLDLTRHSTQTQRCFDIRILDVVPLQLDTVYVTVERHLLRDHDDVQSRFGGGFRPGLHGPYGIWAKAGKGFDSKRYTRRDIEERLTSAVRQALSEPNIIHIGDVLPLPLPPHPITYAPPPPARVSFCEPVSQGVLMPTTKIVLIQSRQHGQRGQKVLPVSSHSLTQVVEDEADDTSNEQFYSAAEDKPQESSTEMESTSAAEESETDASVGYGSDTSDDSLDGMISLSAPELPQGPSGIMSAITSATPRPGRRRTDGMHTPGSVASNFTSATLRAGRAGGGKIFKVEGLLRSVPLEVLHPKPREDEDSESFIFVDISTLAKIGCFSGDWVKIEASEEPHLNIFASLKIGNFNEQQGESGDWRPVKIFGLPGFPSAKPRYPINQSTGRRSSISQRPPPQRFTPTVFVPPLLLNNLDNPKYLRISSMSFPTSNGGPKPGLMPHTKTGSTRSPALAKEVTLLKVCTPLSTDRALQPALFAGLKQYFGIKRRLLKSGDLLGICVDETLGRTVFSATGSHDGTGQDDELTLRLGFAAEAGNLGPRKVGVAWFRVGHVTFSNPDDLDEFIEDQWGGVASIDSAITRMVQAGTEISRIPGTLENCWEYWLAVKALPKYKSHLPSLHGLITEVPQSFVSPLQKRIRDLMSAATSPRAIQLGMKPVVILLKSQQRHIGKATVTTRACADIGLHTFSIDAYDILTEGGANGGDVKTEAHLKARAERAFHCGSSCTALLIRHIEVLTADRIVTAMNEIISDARVLIATTTDVEKIPEGIRSLFTHEFEMMAPDEKEREGILLNAILDRSIRLSPDVDLSTVALKTAALVAGDLVDVVERALSARTARLQKLAESASKDSGDWPVSVRDVLLSGGDAAKGVTKLDFDTAVDTARMNFADAIGAPKIPSVSWEDVGGLTNVKDALIETIQLPLERPELFAKGMKKRSGILFYGPPGTGKTLLAKAIATEFSLNFFSVKGPELLNMYIGESEANVRRVFQRARDARPCVVFFDELDSVAPKRGNQGDSGGVMDRIVSQLLAELDGMNGGEENSGGVFVIGATNRPDLLDTALLRPGRFDKMLYLGVSDTHEKQATILEALTRKFTLHSDVSLSRVANRLPFTYTGADLYALCSDAMLKAITRKATAVDEKIKRLPNGPVSTAYFFDHLSTPEDVSVMVTEEDFLQAQHSLVPSVSVKELEHFERIRRTFESVDKQKQDAGSTQAGIPQTIGDAIEALGAHGAQPLHANGTVPNGDHYTMQKSSNKGKGKHGAAPAAGAPAASGSLKGKAVAAPGGDSDSSFDRFTGGVVRPGAGGASNHGAIGGEEDDAVVADGERTNGDADKDEDDDDEDDDDYVVQT